jgi:hypothetical protein
VNAASIISALTASTASLLVMSLAHAQEPQNAASPVFTGSSKTTAVLRHDILGTLIPMFVAHEHCAGVESIDATFVAIDKDASGRVTGMKERWRAFGCGKSAAFDVQLTRTRDDQTDYVVSPVPTAS